MNAVDASDHYEIHTTERKPSLLTVIVDTNPRAWAVLRDVLPLPQALANLLVFINAHLALSNTNQVAVIAAHPRRAVWLYPQPPPPIERPRRSANGDDVVMTDAPPTSATAAVDAAPSANKFPQFARVERAVMASMQRLMDSTDEADLAAAPKPQLSGALTMALCHLNKTMLALGAAAKPTASALNGNNNAAPRGAAAGATPGANGSAGPKASGQEAGVNARIFVLSVSDSEPTQYIPTMNAVFAAAHAGVLIDTLALTGDATFLEQACFNTNGTFFKAAHPRGLITYLMQTFLASADLRRCFVPPTQGAVDFRAACFCHGRVVDVGFVCSVCLSIFCEELRAEEACPTCGSHLALGSYGAKPAVVARPKKKKKRRGVNGTAGAGGANSEDPASATGTPKPMT